MSEAPQPASGGQSKVVIALVAVVVVLAATIVGLVVFKKPATPATPSSAAANTAGGTSGTIGGMPGSTGAQTPFDPKTATKVAEGESPEGHVKAYFDAVVKGDFATAYELLPADKRAAQDEAAFADQLKGYGISAYTIDSSTEKDGEAQVMATASTTAGSFQYLWTFVKEGDTWLVKSRTLPGMGQ